MRGEHEGIVSIRHRLPLKIGSVLSKYLHNVKVSVLSSYHYRRTSIFVTNVIHECPLVKRVFDEVFVALPDRIKEYIVDLCCTVLFMAIQEKIVESLNIQLIRVGFIRRLHGQSFLLRGTLLAPHCDTIVS